MTSELPHAADVPKLTSRAARALGPLKLRQDAVFRRAQVERHAEHAVFDATLELYAAVETTLSDDEVDLPAGLQVDDVELPMPPKRVECRALADVVAVVWQLDEQGLEGLDLFLEKRGVKPTSDAVAQVLSLAKETPRLLTEDEILAAAGK